MPLTTYVPADRMVITLSTTLTPLPSVFTDSPEKVICEALASSHSAYVSSSLYSTEIRPSVLSRTVLELSDSAVFCEEQAVNVKRDTHNIAIMPMKIIFFLEILGVLGVLGPISLHPFQESFFVIVQQVCDYEV